MEADPAALVPPLRYPVDLLLELVIDYIGDNITLKNYALVSRRLVYSVHRVLYRKTVVWGVRRSCHEPPRKETRGFEKFAQALGDFPTIGQHIHELSLRGGNWAHLHLPSLCQHTLHQILSQLPKLRLLRIDCVRLVKSCKPDCPFSDSIIVPLPVERVVIKVGSPCASMVDIATVMQVFGDIQHLQIEELDCRDRRRSSNSSRLNSSLAASVSQKLRVHSLVITGGRCPPYFYDILRSTETLQTLTSIDAMCTSLSTVNAIGLLFKDLGPVITSLHLDVSFSVLQEPASLGKPSLLGVLVHGPPANLSPTVFCTYEDWRRLLHLSTCTHLQSLSVPVFLSRTLHGTPQPELEVPTTWAWDHIAIGLLRAVSGSQVMSHITFCVEFSWEIVRGQRALALAQLVNWDKTRRLLAKFPNLTKVSMVFRGGLDVPQECQSIMLEKWEDLRPRVLLEVGSWQNVSSAS